MLAIDTLLYALNQVAPINHEEKLLFSKLFTPYSVSKNQFLLQSGSVNNKLCFLVKGLVRYFVFNGHEEGTIEFTKENEFVADYNSFITQTPSIQNIQAIEDCEFLVINYSDLQTIYQTTPNGNLLGRKIIEHRFNVMVNQLLTVYRYSPEERYQYFLQNYATLTQRIPQYLIASYVGVKPQSLSRIRNRLVK